MPAGGYRSLFLRRSPRQPRDLQATRRSPARARCAASAHHERSLPNCPFRKSYPDVMVVVPSTDPADAELADALGLHRRIGPARLKGPRSVKSLPVPILLDDPDLLST